MMSSKDRIGILLINMGGPRSAEEITPYLYNIFTDTYIISLPFPFKMFNHKFAQLLSKKRTDRVLPRYQQIGGFSPLDEETRKQAKALEAKTDRPVAYAMRYTPPFVNDALEELKSKETDRVVVLPLYPQYAEVTTGSVMTNFSQKNRKAVRSIVIEEHHDNPGFIMALSNLLEETIEKTEPNLKTMILFTAHSIPYKYVKKGDPYVQQVRNTKQQVMERVNSSIPSFLAFQSKIGPVKWQGPSLDEALKTFSNEKIEQLIVQPLSFVAENLETLYDLDIVFREEAKNAGINSYHRVGVPGTHPAYIEGLSDLVTDTIDNWEAKNV